VPPAIRPNGMRDRELALGRRQGNRERRTMTLPCVRNDRTQRRGKDTHRRQEEKRTNTQSSKLPEQKKLKPTRELKKQKKKKSKKKHPQQKPPPSPTHPPHPPTPTPHHAGPGKAGISWDPSMRARVYAPRPVGAATTSFMQVPDTEL